MACWGPRPTCSAVLFGCLCPTADSDDAAFSQVKEIVTATGAQVMVVSPERHDGLVAVVSHVPHLTAATLMRVAVGHTEQHSVVCFVLPLADSVT